MSSLSFTQKYDPNVDVSNMKVPSLPPPVNTATNESSSLAKIDPLIIHSISIQRSDTKKDSDDVIFKKWFDPLESYFDTELSKWEGTRADTIVGEEGEHVTNYNKRKVTEEDIEKTKDYTKKRLHYVLDKSTGWTHGKLLWLVIQCMLPGDRGEYDTPKGEEKEKDPSHVDGGNTREFKNRWVSWLDKWILNNLSSTPARTRNEAEEQRFFQFAKRIISEDKRMINTEKTKSNHLLDKIIGRSYEEITWATVASFGLGVGSRGHYKCGVCKALGIEVDKTGHDCPYCGICYNESGHCVSKVDCRCTCTVCEGSHETRNCPKKPKNKKKRKSM